MSVSYQAVGWNLFKKRYDRILGAGIAGFLLAFVLAGLAVKPEMSIEILLMRGVGVAAFMLLHLTLAIGPLARLDTRFLPLLYNRRHMGVSLFLLALAHALIAILTYHVGSDVNPILSVLTVDAGIRPTAIPFQAFGFLAFLILFVMAATSHDFWLSNLTAPVWKTLHMMVYGAYGLLVAHVVFGALQTERSSVYVALVGGGLVFIAGIHLAAAAQGRDLDREKNEPDLEGFVKVCRVADLQEDIPFGATVAGERVAVLLYEGDKVSCVSGVCQHQNGPLAEGRLVDGCLTCPWHGYQYRPQDGRSPEPFHERIPTFAVRIEAGDVWVSTSPCSAGTPVPPAITNPGMEKGSP